MGSHLVRSALMVTASLAAVGAAVPTAAYAQEQGYDVSIPAQSLGDALRALGRATRQNVVFDGATVRGKRSVAVRGRYTPREALDRMLAGTGLNVTTGPGGVLMVKSVGNGGANPSGNASTLGEEGVTSEEIVVTGTNIQGVGPVGSPVMTFDRASLDSQGFASTEDFVRSLPQNFTGGQLGASADGAVGGGARAGRNLQGSSGVNLRGLGESSTLVLLNGHRLAPSAYGSFIDISVIPLAALERVEVLTDGSSAVYGSDAVAGVVNFRTRSNFNGSDTRFRAGWTTNDGLATQSLDHVTGRTWSDGNLLAGLQIRRQTNLSTDERDFTRNAPKPNDIFPDADNYSVFLTGEQSLSPTVSVYANTLVSMTESKRLLTTTAESARFKSKSWSQSYSGGLRWDFTGSWTADFSGSYGRTSLNSLSVVPLTSEVTRQTNVFQIASGEFKINGALFDLPGGAAKVAVGGNVRREIGSVSSNAPGIASTTRIARTVKGGFGELFLPLVSEANDITGIDSLEVSLALRHDNYSDFGSTTNPKIGLRWEPVRGLAFRASWGKSFRPPVFAEQLDSSGLFGVLVFPFTAPDGLGSVPTFVLVGAGDNLRAERSRTWTLGVDLTPKALPGLTLSATYYHIDFRDRIVTPPSDFNALTTPDVYGSLISTLGSDGEAAAFLQGQLDRGALFIDPFGIGSAGVRYIFNAQTQNAARVIQTGVDLTLAYEVTVGSGKIGSRLNAAFIDKIDTSLSFDGAATDIANSYGNPLKRRIRADLTWEDSGLSLNAGLSHSNAYKDTTVNPVRRVSSWTTVDLAGRFSFSETSALSGISIGVVANNLFDKKPPFVNGGIGFVPGINYDSANADPRGRFVAFDLRANF